ncbi:CATRA system-associated protein, partial [Actinophytocola sp.]|uniref:CATRA system-associated protein n=1 Tax=Actinophytocola sp. TaxID=1872138 RepID=UPI00389B2A1B
RRTLVAEDRRLFPVLTPLTSATSLPGFLRNIWSLQLNAVHSPDMIAQLLVGEITDQVLSTRDDVDRLFAHTTGVVEWAQEGMRDYDGWFRIEQLLEAMSAAVRNDDLESLRRLRGELEGMTPTPVDLSGRQYPAPGSVINLVSEIVRGLRRRAKKLH